MARLTIEQCVELGVDFPCDVSDSGEHRFRCLDTINGCGYILTRASKNGGWYKSHSHVRLTETFIIQKGWLGLATIDLSQAVKSVQINTYKAGDIVTVRPNVAHNVYIPADCILLAIKHGNCSLPNDWVACPDLDGATKNIDESQIFQRQNEVWNISL